MQVAADPQTVPELVLHALAAEAVVAAAVAEVSAAPVRDEQVLAPLPIGVQVAVAAQTVLAVSYTHLTLPTKRIV